MSEVHPRIASRQRVMVTPEGIALPVTVASRGARAGALFLDLFFIVAIMIITTIVLVSVAGGTAGLLNEAKEGSPAAHALQFLMVLWIIAMFLFRNAWFLFFELGPRGATPGKRITGIRVAAHDGGRLSVEMVIARNLLRDIELFMPVILIASGGVESGPGWYAATAWFLLFMLFPVFNRDRLRAGDVIAGSWVVEAPRQKLQKVMSAAKIGTADAPARTAKYTFTEAQLAVYGEFELKTLERVLRDDREKSVESVYLSIAQKIGRNDGWGDERTFLQDYYTQLRARLEAGMRMGRRKADKFSG